jgi:RNA polymerase sigma factor (sigma-70 family)
MTPDNANPVTEQDDLERLFADARRYPLLEEEQERLIDGRKWKAIRELQELLVRDRNSRRFLGRWSDMCLSGLPEIGAFETREHHFLLRRELAQYLPGGARSEQMVELHGSLSRDGGGGTATALLLALELPASLVAGLAEILVRDPSEVDKSGVGGALLAWMRHWTRAGIRGRPTAANRQKMNGCIRRYLDERNALIMHNLRLVYAIAGRHRGKGLAFTDLVQEGTLGLLRAAEKFQAARGYRFSTYAYNWIQQGIRRSLTDASGAIRYPNHVQEQLGRLYGERGRETARSGSVPNDTALARAAGLSLQKTRELLQLRNLAISLDTPQFDDDEGTTLLDTLPGGPFQDTKYDAERASLNRRLLVEIRRLDPSEQQVVINRWGLHQGPPLSRAEIADKMSVSREWVRQLERSALEKLRRSDTVNSVYRDHNGGAA